MTSISVVQPALLSKINERQVLRTLKTHGPLSRAEVARHSGISAPTASKAVESLLRARLLEEGEAPEPARGRPGKKLRLATSGVQVLALVIDAEQCRLVAAGLDGKLHDERTETFATPVSYAALIDTTVARALKLMQRRGVTTLGMAISIPGLLDYRLERSLLSPNVPITNDHFPSRDVAARLGMPCILIQESHALCLAEYHFGAAQGLDNFAVMDVSTGVGLGVMSGGRLLTGHSGLAGELGHITVDLEGRACGCGNRGCLETVASDSALVWRISQRLGRKIFINDLLADLHPQTPLLRNSKDLPAADSLPAYSSTAGPLFADTLVLPDLGALSVASEFANELEETIRYLAVGLAAAINLFNPSTLFVHGRLFAIDPTLFSRLIDYTRRRALPPAFADCCIIQARGSKPAGRDCGNYRASYGYGRANRRLVLT